LEQQEPTAYVNPYKFNAKELDSETGLYYYGARYYNPRLSIWYGVDPLAVYNPVMETQFYGDGQHNGGVYNFGNLNPYIYCYQNPVIYIDPDGKQTKVVKEGVLMNENFTTLRYKENMLPDYKNTYNARQWIYVAASKQKSENNTTHLYGHGNHYGERSALMMYDKRKEPGNRYSGKFNTKGVRDLLNFENINTNFIDKKGGNIILHGCYARAGDGSVAHTMSIEMPDKLIVGATEYLNYNKDGEIGTYDTAGKKGQWRVYKNGKVIKKYDWNWKPNAKDLNKIKK